MVSARFSFGFMLYVFFFLVFARVPLFFRFVTPSSNNKITSGNVSAEFLLDFILEVSFPRGFRVVSASLSLAFMF